MNPKIQSWLGLARRAGKLEVGDESCLKLIRAGKAQLVILANDASAGTCKKYNDKCSHYHTPLIQYGSRFEIGQAIGRAEQVVVAIMDQGFAKGIRDCMEKTEVQSIE